MNKKVLSLFEAKMKASHMTCRDTWYKAYGTYEGFEEMYEESIKNVHIQFIRRPTSED